MHQNGLGESILTGMNIANLDIIERACEEYRDEVSLWDGVPIVPMAYIYTGLWPDYGLINESTFLMPLSSI
jgi:hypothetical protein